MSNMIESLYNIRILDELGEKRTIIHDIHPLIKVVTTFIFLIVTVSFDKYEINGLLPLVLYPVIIMVLADIPIITILKRIFVIIPFIIGIGALNPIFDRNPMVILPWIKISGGWISFSSILIKGVLTMLAALLLIATTGLPKIAFALQKLRIPKIFIMQLLLTYRYINVLIEETSRIVRSHSLRSPNKKGIQFREWGSLTGQLLLRTIERAKRVYYAMCCRGFTGEYNVGGDKKIGSKDILYLLGWCIYFVVIRYFNIAEKIGLLIIGV